MRFALLLCLVGGASAGLLRADWRTFGGNPQRDGWARDETTLTRENVKGLKLEWKLHLDNVTKGMNSLTPPLVVEKLVTPRGFKDAVVVAGSADTLYAIDTDTGQLMWERKFSAEGKPRFAPSFLCPGALNATPAISNQFWGWTVYVIASDGKLHSVNAVDGEDRLPPIQFVPPYSKNWSLNLAGGELYTGLSQGCDFAKSAVYSLALNDPKHTVKSFQASAAGAGIWGRAGVAISPGGVVYAETGDGPFDEKKGNFSDSFLAISAHDLKLLDYYTPLNRAYLTHKDLDMGCISPLVFPFKQWELVAGGGKEGVLYLLDAKSLGGADHRTPLFRSPRYTNQEINLAGRGFWGALATWADTQEVRWLYAPAWGPQDSRAPEFPTTYGPTPNGSIMAFKVEVKDGKPVLAPAWRSRDLAVPEPPIIANGVVYALSNGENVQSIHESGRLLTSAERIATHPEDAVLYAFDAQTGKELYSSGKTISNFTHMSGLAIANGHIYVATFDNTVYSFGLGTEQ